MTEIDKARQYPKCIYKNGVISDDNITVMGIEAEKKANDRNYWDHIYGKVPVEGANGSEVISTGKNIFNVQDEKPPERKEEKKTGRFK
jgi:hypothetical protein